MRYDTKCTKCGDISECNHSISRPHPPCEKCGEKVGTYFPIGSEVNFTTKGKGWGHE